MKIKHTTLISTLASFILTLVSLEVGLQLFDPMQVKPYFSDMQTIWNNVESDYQLGYVLRPGDYAFSNWSMTINADHSRAVPDSTLSQCVLTVVGDSVTMGHGVSDFQTWINQVAQALTGVQIINAGMNGYNIQQVQTLLQRRTSTGFVYLQTSNDADSPIAVRPGADTPAKAMLYHYLYVIQTRLLHISHDQRDFRQFDRTMAELQQRDDLLIIGFANDELAKRSGVVLIPAWTSHNSPTDRHADAAGNQQIAEAIYPHIDRFSQDVCHA